MKRWDTVAIIGVGLIGGSIGLALKDRQLASRVVGIGRRRSSLSRALRRGAVDATTTKLDRGVADAELTIVCTPVVQIPDFVRRVAQHCPAGALVTDAGSTKAQIVSQVHGVWNNGTVYVGSHPLAGSEKRGVAHARADLYEGSVCVLTPTHETPAAAVERLRRFWRALGARVRIMNAEAHDRALALTSHLPHIAAAALAATLPADLRDLAASGFRDTTRVAAGDPELWTGILSQNRAATLKGLELLQRLLQRYQRALQQGNDKQLLQLLSHAKRNRDALGR